MISIYFYGIVAFIVVALVGLGIKLEEEGIPDPDDLFCGAFIIFWLSWIWPLVLIVSIGYYAAKAIKIWIRYTV